MCIICTTIAKAIVSYVYVIHFCLYANILDTQHTSSLTERETILIVVWMAQQLGPISLCSLWKANSLICSDTRTEVYVCVCSRE